MKPEKITLSNNDKISFIITLTTMLSAGITLVEAFDSLIEDTKGNYQKMIQIIKDDIIQGKRLYMALSKFPLVFDKVTINIVRAAEEAGTLEKTLEEIKKNMEKEIEFIDKIKSALTYPIFILLVLVGVLLIMLLFVIPKIVVVFTRLNVKLPLPTKIMIFISDLMTKNTVLFLVILTILIGGLIIFFITQKKLFFRILSSLPGISQLIKKIDQVRLTRNLAMLLNSGIMIVTGLEICQSMMINPKMIELTNKAKESILSGKKFADGLRTKPLIIPSIIIRMIEAGEKSGSLSKSLIEASNYLDYEISKTLKTLVTLIEPLMLVFVGILVGGMMISIIAPIYGLIGQVGGR